MKAQDRLITIIQSASYALKLMNAPHGGANKAFKRQVNDEIKFLKSDVKKLKGI